MQNSEKKEILTRAAYEAACIEFAESFLGNFDPDEYIYSLTDATLIAAQSGDFAKHAIDRNHLVIQRFRDLKPLVSFYATV